MKDRIRQIMEDQKLNQQSFAQLIGKSTATLSNIFNDRTKPTLDIVDAIKKKFPQVNIEWLLFGTPPMYINKVDGGASGAPAAASMVLVTWAMRIRSICMEMLLAQRLWAPRAACKVLAAWQVAWWSLRLISGRMRRAPPLLLLRFLISLRYTV